MTRLEWVLRKAGMERLIVGGIVTNGGVTSTVRDAHVRDIEATVVEDGCAAFDPVTHETAITALKTVARIETIADILNEARIMIKAPPAAFETAAHVMVVGAGARAMRRARGQRDRRRSRRAGTRLRAARLYRVFGGSDSGRRHALSARAGPCRYADLFAAISRRRRMARRTTRWSNSSRAQAGPTVEWLADGYGLPFSVVHDFDYPGHSARRMHGLPSRSGLELVDRLRAAVEQTPATLLTGATVTALFVDDRRVPASRSNARRFARGDRLPRARARLQRLRRKSRPRRPPHSRDEGRALLRPSRQPRRRGDLGPGTRGEARPSIRLSGPRLGRPPARRADHLGDDHGRRLPGRSSGARFCDESRGYSEQAEDVIARPGGFAWTIFDARIAAIASQFEDFRQAKPLAPSSRRTRSRRSPRGFRCRPERSSRPSPRSRR